jgi:hypothetical protein
MSDRTPTDGHPIIVGDVKAAFRRVLRRLGLEVVRYAPRNVLHLRRLLLLAEERIDLVIDVGAGDGDWSQALRKRATPLESSPSNRFPDHSRLRTRADDRWEAHQVALGAEPGTARAEG